MVSCLAYFGEEVPDSNFTSFLTGRVHNSRIPRKSLMSADIIAGESKEGKVDGKAV